MAILYTHHARERMTLRRVTTNMVEETIFVPDVVEQEDNGKFRAFRRFPQGLLKVVYAVIGGDHLVVSTIWQE